MDLKPLYIISRDKPWSKRNKISTLNPRCRQKLLHDHIRPYVFVATIMRLYILDVAFNWFLLLLDGPPMTAGHPHHSWETTNLLWPWTEASQDFHSWKCLFFFPVACSQDIIWAYRWSDIAVLNLQQWPHQCRPTATHMGVTVSLDKCPSGVGNTPQLTI